MKKILKFFLILLFAAGLFVSVTFTVIEVTAYNDVFYLKQFEKTGVIKDTGLDLQQLSIVVDEIQSLFRMQRDDFFVSVVVDGEYVSIFGEQENFHMIEVRDLFRFFSLVRYICLAALLVIFIICFFVSRPFSRRLIRYASAGVLSVLALIFAAAYFSFDTVFTIFHKLLFNNDLWMFPYDSMLIRILTSEFFVAFGVRTVIGSVAVYAFLIIISFFGSKKEKAALKSRKAAEQREITAEESE